MQNPTETNSDARMMRGMMMLEAGTTIQENEDGSFAVPSQTSKGKFYEVRILGERFVCTCPDFENRQVEACKHIHLVKFTLSVKYLKGEPKPKVLADDAMPCDRCGSIKVIRYGKYGNKPIFYCKDCKHKFREPSAFKKAKFTPELITLTLDLYFSGMSLRKIVRTVADHFQVKLGSTTIYKWLKRYIPLVSRYVNTLAPKLSQTWHADELFVRVRGGTHQGRPIGFVWNIMDRETRFLIVSKLTATRNSFDCAAAFEDAQATAHGIEPKIVYTDSLRHYKTGVQTFANAERIDNCGLMKQNNNNRIERLNGTLRERTKVQRGWKTTKTVLAEGNRLQYDFVKPHHALKGKTPAQVCGIGVDGNKWRALIEAAKEREANQ